MASVAPLPTVTMVMTALTPITMPRMVRNERSRLRRIERMASSRVLSHMSGSLCRSRGRHGLRTGSVMAGAGGMRVAGVADDHAIDKMHDAFGVGRHVGLVCDHQHGDAVIDVQTP